MKKEKDNGRLPYNVQYNSHRQQYGILMENELTIKEQKKKNKMWGEKKEREGWMATNGSQICQ